MAKRSAAAPAILALLAARGASTSSEIIRATGFSRHAVRVQLLRLQASGRVGRHQHGVGPGHKAFWFLVPEAAP